MEKQELRALLEQLRLEVEQTTVVDEKGRELLRALEADIHDLLQRSEGPHFPSLFERLQETISHFEVEHPSLTATLSQVLDSLSNIGI